MQGHLDAGGVRSQQKNRFLVAAAGVEGLVGDQRMQRLIRMCGGQEYAQKAPIAEQIAAISSSA